MYFCKICKKYFSKSKKKDIVVFWKEYSEGKQTQEQIAQKTGQSREWVNKKLKKESPHSGKNLKISSQKIVLIIDTTYFNQFGLMVFRAANLKKNLLWKIVEHETNEAYRMGIEELIDDGWVILGIVADGKPGLGKLFPQIPFQLCQFHQFQTVTRYISKNPKLQASQEFRQIMFRLKEADKASFEFWITEWHKKWKEFLAEKTVDPVTQKSTFTHQRLRQAFFGVRRNLDPLFICDFYSEDLKIPNTTNSLDGYFSHLKSKISVHRGASKNTQINLISDLIFL